MARSEGLEPPTYKFVACCSIQLSYDRTAANGTSRFFFSPLTREIRGGEGGIRTLGRFLTVGHLANDWFQPLTHLSVGPHHYTTRPRDEPAPRDRYAGGVRGGGSSTTSGMTTSLRTTTRRPSRASMPARRPAGTASIMNESMNAAASRLPIVDHFENSPLTAI